MDSAWDELFDALGGDHGPLHSLKRLVLRVRSRLGVERCTLSIPTTNDRFMRLIDIQGMGDELPKGIYFLATNSVATLASGSRPFLWKGDSAHRVPGEARVLDGDNCQQLLVLPLCIAKKQIGVMSFGPCIGDISQSTMTDLRVMGALIASSLAEHLASEQRKDYRRTSLNYRQLAISVEAMGRQADRVSLYQCALNVLIHTLNFAMVAIYEADGPELVRYASCGGQPADVLPKPLAWEGSTDRYDEIVLVAEGSSQTILFPLFQESALLGAVQITAPRTELRDSNRSWMLHIALASLSSCLKKQANYADALTSREAAESANAAKNRFLANISHEVRTPLNSIVGLSSLLAERGLPRDSADLLNTITKSADVLKSIIQDLLDLSRMESGNIELVCAPFDAREAISQCVEIARSMAMEKQLKMETNIADAFPAFVHGDETRITQVVLNLLSNAIKFTDDGSVSISLDYDHERGVARVEITDTGIGMSQRVTARVFEPFYQAPDSLGQNRGGTGLGLAISRQLVSLMCGEINVLSERRHGTTFITELPLAIASIDRPIADSSQQPSLAAPAPYSHVMFVDDNELNRITAQALLSSLCDEFVMAESGLQAVELAEELRPNVILMDINMPGIDGLEATRRIRKKSLPRQPFIVAVSGHVQEYFQEQAHDAGVDAFLEKPYSVSELRELLRRASDSLNAPPSS